jgi:hypothetical protein
MQEKMDLRVQYTGVAGFLRSLLSRRMPFQRDECCIRIFKAMTAYYNIVIINIEYSGFII